ncbi:MAG: hypothetical protein IT368_17835 [Candidatus Hydrogenedentes bacterium]|nr:hypothetical protein [Candidatus Hydrogenedentota bacterium]
MPVILGFFCAAPGAVGDSSGSEIRVSVRENCTAGGLSLAHTALPENIFAYLSCEAVLFGAQTQSTPLFEVKVACPGGVGPAVWDVDGDSYSYDWNYDQGIRVAFAAKREPSSVKLGYTVTNLTDKPLERVLLHTCVPTTQAPSFFPEWKESAIHEPGATGNYMGLYDRVFLWKERQKFSFRGTEKGDKEIHLSLMSEGTAPIEWAWWVNGPERFTLPLIVVTSKDGKFAAGLGFERALWASCNGGDERACFHLFPSFGDIAPGSSATVKGAFYLLPGSAEDVRERFLNDFPAELSIDK